MQEEEIQINEEQAIFLVLIGFQFKKPTTSHQTIFCLTMWNYLVLLSSCF